MPSRAFLDSNVFIFSFERTGSNWQRIVELLVTGGLRGVVTDRVVREVMRYFRKYHGKDLAAKFRELILLTSDFILEEELRVDGKLFELVGRRDASALAAVRSIGISHLVSTDSDFDVVPEHRTPRECLQGRGERARPGDE